MKKKIFKIGECWLAKTIPPPRPFWHYEETIKIPYIVVGFYRFNNERRTIMVNAIGGTCISVNEFGVDEESQLLIYTKSRGDTSVFNISIDVSNPPHTL